MKRIKNISFLVLLPALAVVVGAAWVLFERDVSAEKNAVEISNKYTDGKFLDKAKVDDLRWDIIQAQYEDVDHKFDEVMKELKK